MQEAKQELRSSEITAVSVYRAV